MNSINAIDAYDSAIVTRNAATAGSVVTLFIMVITLFICVLSIVANWKIFTKAGEKGWKSLIPIYSSIVMFKIAGISPLWILGYLFTFIPVVGTCISIGITIYFMYNLAKVFGKDVAFTVGLVLLNTIFMLILAFGKAEYTAPKVENT
ncbi:MAG: signal peptidase I [Clostridia bacterium]|nr:signal peptidase I [Clostridia bacterium]